MRAPIITEKMKGHGLAEWETQEISVKDPPFNAVGNSTTDDTAAIQAALNAGASAKRPVYLPSGTYMFSNLTLPVNTILFGAGISRSILKRIIGSTGIAMQESGDAWRISLSHFQIHGQDCDGTLLSLGNVSTQWGYVPAIHYLLLQHATGGGFWINGNVGRIDNVETAFVTEADYLTGVGNLVTNYTNLGLGAVGLTLEGTANILVNIHFEGDYGTAAVDITGYVNTLTNVNATIGEGNTLAALVHIASDRLGTTLSNLSAYAFEGAPDGIITCLVFDESGSVPRTIVGDKGLNSRIRHLAFYGTGYLRNTTRAGSNGGGPTEGTWTMGDEAYSNRLGHIGYGWPTSYFCVSDGSPGVWANSNTLPGAIAKSSNYIVDANDSGKRFSNAGAAGPVTFTLPGAATKLEYEFISVVNGQVLRIDPVNGAEHFVNQVGGKYMELAYGEVVRIGRGETNTWYIIKQVGTPSYEV